MQFCLLDHDRVLDVEESGSSTHLLQIGVPERIVDNDVQDLTHSILRLGDFASLGHVHLDHGVLVDHDGVSLTAEDGTPVHGLVDFSEGPNGFAGDDKRPESTLHLASFRLDDSLDTVRIPELHRLDFHRILADLQRSAQFQPELVTDHVDHSGAFGVLLQRKSVIRNGFGRKGHHPLLFFGTRVD